MFAIAMAMSIAGFIGGALIVASGVRWRAGQSSVGRVTRILTLGALIVVVGLVVGPHLYEELGAPGPALLLVGFAAHRLVALRSRATGHVASALVVPVLAIHSALDGAALALLSGAATGVAPLVLSLPVALHRIPEGMLLAFALMPRVGARITLAAAALLGATTLGGGFAGRVVLGAISRGAFEALLGIGVGVLVSALLRTHPHGRSGHEPHDHAHA